MIVTDAGIVVAALVDDGVAGAGARRRLSEEELVAPELVDLETLSVLRRLHHRGLISTARADQAAADLGVLPITRAPHAPLITRCWQLRETVTTYDAAYVALAESLGVPLVTTDARLTRAPGPTCTFEVLTLP